MCTNHGSVLFVSSFLDMFLDILKSLLFAQLTCHPQCTLKPSQPGDGHMKAHGIHEAHLGTLEKQKYILLTQLCLTELPLIYKSASYNKDKKKQNRYWKRNKVPKPNRKWVNSRPPSEYLPSASIAPWYKLDQNWHYDPLWVFPSTDHLMAAQSWWVSPAEWGPLGSAGLTRSTAPQSDACCTRSTWWGRNVHSIKAHTKT